MTKHSSWGTGPQHTGLLALSVAHSPLSTFTRRALVLAPVGLLFAWLFGEAIFLDRNFVYRDAGQFYYPLLRLVQEEWRAGRWPLWNSHENGGMPLLGNPASAVLYPVRIVFFQWMPLSYGVAYKSYILFHVLLCVVTAWALARHWRLSEFATGLAALSYAFGAVVMFQYCNVIFLVGASWLPLGLLAADRSLSVGDWPWAGALGLVLAMQLLGGDPEAGYVTGGLAALYLAMLDAEFGAGLLAVFAIVFLSNEVRVDEHVRTPAGWFYLACALGVVVASGTSIWWGRRRRQRGQAALEDRRLVWRRRGCLAVAAAVCLGVSAAQWLPSWEFGRISNRAAGGVHYEPYAFWVGPWRYAEFVWAGVYGRQFPTNSRWLDIFKIKDRLWEPSLYFGVIPTGLALTAWSIRNATHWRRWLSWTLVLCLWAAMGPSGGVSWYSQIARAWTEKPSGSESGEEGASSGPTKSALDLDNPAGGLYWVMLQSLPGFDNFRFPAKLLTFAAVAFALLAGAGWDNLFNSPGTRALRLFRICAVVSMACAALASVARPWILARFAEVGFTPGVPYYGPFLGREAWRYILTGFLASGIVLGLFLLAHRLLRSRWNHPWTQLSILGLVAFDIGAANRWMVATAPQSMLDEVPAVYRILEEAEREESAERPLQPFRVHRISIWSPLRWETTSSSERDVEIFHWEKNTIQPKYGLPYGVNYTINEGTLEPYDYWWFFAPFYSNTTPEPRSVVYYPRRGFDMWGAKYFILPKGSADGDQSRGVRTFMSRARLIADSPPDEDDFQVLRNESYFPRAWIVHKLLFRPPIRGLARSDRLDRMREILYPGFDGLWLERNLEGQVQDPHTVAWVEPEDPSSLAPFQDPTADRAQDVCGLTHYDPDHIEIVTESPARGLLVLADLYYPGWNVTVDGQPAPLVRTNRMMRGVPLSPGRHHVVFQYSPLTFHVGAAISLASLAVMILVGSVQLVRWLSVP